MSREVQGGNEVEPRERSRKQPRTTSARGISCPSVSVARPLFGPARIRAGSAPSLRPRVSPWKLVRLLVQTLKPQGGASLAPFEKRRPEAGSASGRGHVLGSPLLGGAGALPARGQLGTTGNYPRTPEMDCGFVRGSPSSKTSHP